VGTSTQNFTNQFGCDSVVTTNTSLNTIYDIQLSATTCNLALVGVAVLPFTSIEGCDSIVTTTTTLLPSNAVTVNATTCNPANVGTSTQNFTNQFGCDSVVTTITTLSTGQGQPIIIEQFTCNPSDTGIVSTTYLNQYGCDSIVIIETNLASISIDNISTTNANCLGLDGTVTFAINGGSAPYEITISNTNGIVSVGNSNIVSGLETGSYAVSIRDINGCSTSGNFEIEQNPLNSLVVSPTLSTIELGESVQFESNPSDGIFSWNPPTYLDCDTCANPIALPDFDITYIISLKDDLGCFAYDTVTIQVKQPGIFVPSAFSPNGDNDNDYLLVIDKNIAELVIFRIFNRWGNLVFESNDITQGWDGSYKGKAQDIDTYVYDLEVILFTGQRMRISGHVLLLR
jgi:gliding motility-associated-like protein